MIEVMYGILVIAAGYAAAYSHCEMIQKIMATLFAGWLVYVNAQSYASFDARVVFNAYIDVAQIGVVSLLYLSWRECAQSGLCWWVLGCFCIMGVMHLAQLSGSIDLYWYYLACNLLFTAQLVAVVVYSRLSYNNWRKSKTEAPWRTTTHGSGSHDLKVVPMRRKTG